MEECVPFHGGSGLGWDQQYQDSAGSSQKAERGTSSSDLPDADRCSQMQACDSGRPFNSAMQAVLKLSSRLAQCVAGLVSDSSAANNPPTVSEKGVSDSVVKNMC